MFRDEFGTRVLVTVAKAKKMGPQFGMFSRWLARRLLRKPIEHIDPTKERCPMCAFNGLSESKRLVVWARQFIAERRK